MQKVEAAIDRGLDLGGWRGSLPFSSTRPAEVVPAARYPYHELVPKDIDANLRFRKDLLAYGAGSQRAADELWCMCSRDLLFYVNAFLWVFDPRDEVCAVKPFVTYPYQDGLFMALEDAIGSYNLTIEKCRDMTATTSIVTTFEHQWHFGNRTSFGVASRKEPYVDDRKKPGALLPKFDFLHEFQPEWLLPGQRHLGWDDPNRTHLKLVNPDNGTVVVGETTNADMFRGDRHRAVMVDEFASVPQAELVVSALASVTKCRLWNSTPKGAVGAFAQRRKLCLDQENKGSNRLISLPWFIHPEKNADLSLDAKGKATSPWYVAECEDIGHPRKIAQEIDIDYTASDYGFFDGGLIDRLMNETATVPVHVGRLRFDPETGEPHGFEDSAEGPLRLWCALNEDGRPPQETRYVIGSDVATGSQDEHGRGSSYSAASVWSLRTNEKVAEFTDHGLAPQDFARQVAALGWWFGGEAEVAWEATGPGTLFGQELERLKYLSVYRDPRAKTGHRSRFGGLVMTGGRDGSRLTMFEAYRYAMHKDRAFNRSHGALAECRHYVMPADGSTVYHSASASAEDPKEARANHGDIVIGDVIGVFLLRESSRIMSSPEPRVPLNCLATYRRHWAADERRRKKW